MAVKMLKSLFRESINMADPAEKDDQEPIGFDPLIQTEDISFRPGELIACSACGRKNPPNRFKCIYCAGALEVEADKISGSPIDLRRLEIWERGTNLIIRQRSAEVDVAGIARLLSRETDDIRAIVDAAMPLPIVRVESEQASQIIQHRLAELGLECFALADDRLAADRPPVRLSGLVIEDDLIAFRAFNTGQTEEFKSDELALLVVGTLRSSKVDAMEKKGRRGKSTLIDETATAADEMILDVYCRNEPTGYRVLQAGFDFSCLAGDKGLLAAENLRRLVVSLKECSPNVKVVNDYSAVRHQLGNVWELESRKDSQGLIRSGFGKVEFGSVESTNNLIQFTKYSRLQWHLL